MGNLQIFSHPDKINGYAHFLQSLGPALWGVRLVMLAAIGIHVWAAVCLYIENKAARGPEKYGVHKWLKASLASRYMRMSGLVVLAFIIYHIAHFTVGATWAEGEHFKSALSGYVMQDGFHLLGFPIVDAGEEVHDVYSMVFMGFMNPWVSGFYMLATTLLALHLLHGADSMFQTVGWRNHRWACGLRGLVTLFCLFYALGNIAIPGAILTGIAKPAEGTTAADYAAERCAATAACNK